MDENIEYNFLLNQINANNQIRSVIQQQISSLLAVVHQNRQWMEQLDENDRQLNLRMNAIGGENKTLVAHSNDYKG